MSASSARTGGCLCGAVRYEVHGRLRPIVVCHCGQCRRATGHVMAATAAWRSDFRLLASQGLKWYVSSPEARRGFCAQCGSTLFWEGTGRDYLSIAAGSLDDGSDLTVACHIFVGDKRPYDEIAAGEPQVPGGNFTVAW